MKAVLTAGFLETVPAPIRDKLHLKTGMVMEFDETSAYLKATPVTDQAEDEIMSEEEFKQWLAESVGIAKGMPSTDEMMRKTRGED
jgi:bifunctional DNA-binding transcriptional regulator/antitoxin component of YhaV-PrlF toxin-antitoxin module